MASSKNTYIIGTRGSDLALWQAKELQRILNLPTELKIIKTRGDKDHSKPLHQSGGDGLFTKELEASLKSGEIDLAVHSLKDLPIEQPEGLKLGAILKRENPCDCLIIREESFDEQKFILDPREIPLKEGSIVGTSSPRREGLLNSFKGEYKARNIRGNLPTRIQKLRDGEFDGIFLAVAGLKRISANLEGLRVYRLLPEVFPSSPGQGAIAVQCSMDCSEQLQNALFQINDTLTEESVNLERRILQRFGGGCHMPLGAFARADENGNFKVVTWVGDYLKKDPHSQKNFHVSHQGQAYKLPSEVFDAYSGSGILKAKKYLNTRPEKNSDSLSLALRAECAEVIHLPVIKHQLKDNWKDLLSKAESYGGDNKTVFILTSPYSAEVVMRYFESRYGLNFSEIINIEFASIGSATSSICEAFGVSPIIEASVSKASVLSGELKAFDFSSGTRFVFMKSALAENHFHSFDQSRLLVQDLYSPTSQPVDLGELSIPMSELSGVIFYSPSAVEALFENPKNLEILENHGICAYSIGKKTSEALRAAKFTNIQESRETSSKSVIEGIIKNTEKSESENG